MQKEKIICVFIIAAIIALATACNTERRFNDYSIKHPDKFKSLAAILAPCSDEISKTDTLYQTKTDTLTTPAISDTVTVNDTVRITKYLPGKVITKTEVRTVTNQVPDTRMLEAANIKARAADDKALESETKLKATEKNRNNWRTAFFVLIGLVIGWFFLSKYVSSLFGWVKGVVKL